MAQALHRQLREERAAIVTQASALAQKPNITAAERARCSALLDQVDTMTRQIEQLEAPAMGTIRGGRFGTDRPSESEGDPAHVKAFRSYLHLGAAEMPGEELRVLQGEHRDMGTGGGGAYPGSTGGFFAPIGFVNRIVQTMKFTGPMLDPDVIEMMDSATGSPLPYPTDNDVSVTGERVAEGAQVTSADVALGQLMLGAYKYSTKLIKVSLELMQDSAFDLESYLVQKFSERLGRILVSDFTVGLGSGSAQPLGVITSTVSNGTLLAAVGSAANDGTSASTNTIGSDDLINLEHGIDKSLRPGAAYMAHDSTWKKFKQAKDKYGRPLWSASLIPNQPDTFGGYPLLTNNFMDTLSATPNSPPVVKNVVCFGNYKRYLVRRVLGMSVLTLKERFADFGQLGFICFARFDGTPLYGTAATGASFPFSLLQSSY